MDSKRKVNGGGAGGREELDDRAPKRRKVPTEIDLTKGETVRTTEEYGLAFLDQLRLTKDKSGRDIATAFLSLPDKKALPDYYKITKLPIALDTIEAKLKNHDFPTLSTLESYFKRMVQNAKEYNERGSQISEDAERIRKALSNYMTKHNPAYKTPGYISLPTPIPDNSSGDTSEADVEEVKAEAGASKSKRQRGRPPKNPQAVARAQSQRSSATPAVSETKYAGVSYSGLTLQQAQEKIVSDMITYKEDPEDEYAYFHVFIELPPRSLKVYYQMIPNPMSLRKLQMRVVGNHGKNGSTGVSEFKNWAALEEDMSLIWRNAKHFNEDGSEIFNLAIELETFFHKALREAKQAVPDPAPPKIKLKLAQSSVSDPPPVPKITLKVGGKASPADSPAPQANGTIGNTTIAARRNPFGSASSSTTAQPPSLDLLDRARSASGSAASPTPSTSAVVKNEEGARASPAMPLSAGPVQSGYRAPSQPVSTPNATGMPPPSGTAPSLHNTYSSGGYAQSFNHQSQYQIQNQAFESKWRQAGRGAADAMITNLSLATHPGLNITKHFRMDLPPSPTMAQQSITINLPSSHYYLQIKPTISPTLFDRQHKLFVTSNISRLHAMPTIPGHSVDPRHPLFEARLIPGVNRIEIELIAALPKGASNPASGQDVELEKITVFANLMR